MNGLRHKIRISGKANQAVFERLLSTLIFISECNGSASRRNALEEQVELISQYADQTLPTDYEKEKIRRNLSEARRSLRA